MTTRVGDKKADKRYLREAELPSNIIWHWLKVASVQKPVQSVQPFSERLRVWLMDGRTGGQNCRSMYRAGVYNAPRSDNHPRAMSYFRILVL